MKSKKVAIVVKYFPLVSETFIVNQINALKAVGCQVTLLAYNKVEGIPIHKSLHRYNLLDSVCYFKKAPTPKLKRLLVFFQWVIEHLQNINWTCFFKSLNIFKHGKDAYTLKLFYESQWFILKHDFDILHAHFGMNGNRIAYLKTKGIIAKTVPLLTTFHGYDMEPNKLDNYKFVYKYLFEQGTAFTVNTPYLEALLKKANPETPIYILPVGLDTSLFKRKHHQLDNAHFNIVFCGRLIYLKGPDMAIDILNRLLELGYNHVRLHLVGTGKLLKVLHQQITSYRINDYVYLHSAMTQEAIIELYEHCDVLLLPGRYDVDTGRADTQGLVIQEAQAMELPVVVSDVGGMKYGLIDGKTGFVVKEDDIEGFVKKIEMLIKNPKLGISMGKNGREFVVKNYDNTVLVEKVLKIYTHMNNFSKKG